jgi:hypothetical protein
VIQSAKGAHCPTLAVSARQNEMMADVPDVDGTTCKRLDQPLRRDLPMADRGYLPRKLSATAESTSQRARSSGASIS